MRSNLTDSCSRKEDWHSPVDPTQVGLEDERATAKVILTLISSRKNFTSFATSCASFPLFGWAHGVLMDCGQDPAMVLVEMSSVAHESYIPLSDPAPRKLEREVKIE